MATESLCTGWDVKTVAAHLVSPLTDGTVKPILLHLCRPRRSLAGIVKLLTLCGGCEDCSLWRLRRGTRATGIRSRSSGTRCGCITVSR
ncbi:MAG TPA: hypothetical protein VEF72_27520 [Mycobacterium sp.]|nr:hypothetical protein [Mycobacterium sp.]